MLLFHHLPLSDRTREILFRLQSQMIGIRFGASLLFLWKMRTIHLYVQWKIHFILKEEGYLLIIEFL